MQTGDSVHDDVKRFVVAEFLFGNESALPSDESSLVETGIIDSTGVLELIEYIEDHFAIAVLESETVLDNLGSIAGITAYVHSKIKANESTS